jgi:hypothetical protein
VAARLTAFISGPAPAQPAFPELAREREILDLVAALARRSGLGAAGEGRSAQWK